MLAALPAGAQSPESSRPEPSEAAAAPPAVEAQAPGPDVVQDRDVRDVLLKRPEHKSWRVAGDAQYRQLLVTDEDPANDRYLLYRAQASYYPLAWLSLFARLGVFQRFVAVQGESGVRMEDTVLGATAEQWLPLESLGWQRTLQLSHSLRVYLPTSFASHEQNLYLAAEWSTRARLRLVDELFAGVRGTLHYRFNEYAEQAGPEGGTLPRFVVELRPFVEYSPIVSEKWGTLTLGADVAGDETIDYPSRDPASLSASELPPGTLSASAVSGAGSSDSFVTPHYGYDLYVVYTPPVPYLSFSVSLEQAGNVVRYGEPRLYFIHRDQTELAFHLTVAY
jgi:hypothetical protein